MSLKEPCSSPPPWEGSQGVERSSPALPHPLGRAPKGFGRCAAKKALLLPTPPLGAKPPPLGRASKALERCATKKAPPWEGTKGVWKMCYEKSPDAANPPPCERGWEECHHKSPAPPHPLGRAPRRGGGRRRRRRTGD